MNVLQIQSGRLDRVPKKAAKSELHVENRGKHTTRPNKHGPVVYKIIQEVVDKVPKYTPHYADATYSPDNIVYLAPLVTMSDLYSVTKAELELKGVSNPPSQTWFSTHMAQKYPNLRIKKVSKDTCNANVCDDLTLSPEDKATHVGMYKAAQKLYSADKTKDYTFVFDMMSTLPLPKLECNLAFYKRQLWT